MSEDSGFYPSREWLVAIDELLENGGTVDEIFTPEVEIAIPPELARRELGLSHDGDTAWGWTCSNKSVVFFGTDVGTERVFENLCFELLYPETQFTYSAVTEFTFRTIAPPPPTRPFLLENLVDESRFLYHHRLTIPHTSLLTGVTT